MADDGARTPGPDEAPPVAEGTTAPVTRSGLSLVLYVLGAVLVIAAAAVAENTFLSEDSAARDTHGAKIHAVTVDSRLLDDEMPVKVVVPKAAADDPKRSLLIFLHGRGEDENSYLVDPMFKALGHFGGRAPVIAFPYGGDSSYWHDRDDGEWGSYVLDELLPKLIERFDIYPAQIAVGGISMGGFGAYDLARLRPGTFCALGHSAGDTAPGAFDDDADYERHDVITAADTDPSPYEGLPMWLDAGESDPFLDGDAAFEDAARAGGAELTVKSWPGEHDSGYWNSHWNAYLHFYASHLHDCAVAAREERERAAKDRERGKAGDDARAAGSGPPPG